MAFEIEAPEDPDINTRTIIEPNRTPSPFLWRISYESRSPQFLLYRPFPSLQPSYSELRSTLKSRRRKKARRKMPSSRAKIPQLLLLRLLRQRYQQSRQGQLQG
jgi:hypothetical protein